MFQSETPWIVRATIRLSGGFIKNENQANLLLGGVVVLIFGICLYLLSGRSSHPAQPYGGGTNPDFVMPTDQKI